MMWKTKKKGGRSKIGQSLIKDRNRSRRLAATNGGSWLHSSDLEDGYEWGRLNLHSVTEESRLDEFLSTAELAGLEFTAEKLNIKVVDRTAYTGLPSEEERVESEKAQEENYQYLSIPRRPQWNSSTTPEQLELKERESFLDWRRNLARLQEDERLTLTPFERNLEFWRQLWRVVEKSDIVVQIVDARNPLLFRCEDLEKYVCEIDSNKVNMVLISKADLLTSRQRQSWADYFNMSVSVVVAFWSATLETQHVTDVPTNKDTTTRSLDPESIPDDTETRILTGQQLVDLFLRISPVPAGSLTTVGMVGYPNVGKSSTINALFQGKKVPVSATPGRTKHFQTLYLREELLLCDCPGLVFPSFISSKAEMVCSGILSIDQLQDHVPPVSLVCQRIPRSVLEETYGIDIPRPKEGEDEDRPPYAHELLSAYGYMRGYRTSHGLPDEPRSARYILKDYVNGKLLYCHPPPGKDEKDFNHQLSTGCLGAVVGSLPKEDEQAPLCGAHSKTSFSEFDSQYFQQKNVRAITKGVHGSTRAIEESKMAVAGSKPWKKHHNRQKKEKTRRTYT